MASKSKRTSVPAGVHSLEGVLNGDGQLVDWSFNEGRKAGTKEELDAAYSALEANFDFIQMLLASHIKSAPKIRQNAGARPNLTHPPNFLW